MSESRRRRGGDLTKQHKIEEELQDSEGLLQNIIDGSPSFIFLKDRDGRFITINKRLEESLGMKREKLRGKTDYDVFSEEVADYYRRNDHQVIETKQPIQTEETFDSPDGRKYTLLANKFPLFDASGEVIATCGISTDITERKKTQEALRLSEEKFSKAFNNSPIAISITRLSDGKIIEANEFSYKLFGWSSGEALGRTTLDLGIWANPDDRFKLVKALIADGSVENMELLLRKRDGTHFPVDLSATLLTVAGEQCFICSFMDLTERKKVLELVLESQKKYRDLTETAADFVWEVDAQGRYTYCSPQMEKLWGLKPSDMIGKTPFDMMPVDAGEKASESFMRFAVSPKPFRLVNLPSYDARGNLVFLEINGVPFFDDEGKLLGFRGMTRDVTERRKAEEANSKQASLIDLSPDAIIVKTLDDTITFWSKGAEELYGWARGDALGRKSRELFKTQFPESYDKTLDELRSKGRWSGEKIHTTKDGKQIMVYSRWLAQKNSRGELEEILETNENITERKKAEEALKRRQAEIQTLFENTPAGLVLFEAKSPYRVLAHNRYYQELFDEPFRSQGMVGLNIYEYAPEVEASGVKAVFDEVVAAKKSKSFLEFPYRSIPPKQTWFNWYIAPIVLDGEIVALVSMSLDVTDRHRASEVLKQRNEDLENLQRKLEEKTGEVEEYANRMEQLAEERAVKLRDAERLAAIGATAGMVGHDIRNPLQSISGDIYLAMQDLIDLPQSEQKQNIRVNLEKINKSVEYINKIVADLQDFARPLNPIAEEINLKTVVNDLLTRNALPGNVKSQVRIENSAAKLVADSSFVKRIVGNLVTNAVQAMPHGGVLTISAHKDSGGTAITVSDTGEGIPEDARSKLFTPLFTTKAKGQGFGLAAVKRVTEAMNGTITFESQIGKGTTFTVRLPPPHQDRR